MIRNRFRWRRYVGADIVHGIETEIKTRFYLVHSVQISMQYHFFFHGTTRCEIFVWRFTSVKSAFSTNLHYYAIHTYTTPYIVPPIYFAIRLYYIVWFTPRIESHDPPRFDREMIRGVRCMYLTGCASVCLPTWMTRSSSIAVGGSEDDEEEEEEGRWRKGSRLRCSALRIRSVAISYSRLYMNTREDAGPRTLDIEAKVR